MEVKYSIIIPHYNTPGRLRILLESIPQKPEIQVIVVDDNSTKECSELETVIKNDGRCKFYLNNTGIQSAGACRNVGLSHATGKWVLFSDADDYFITGFTEHLDSYYDSMADIVYFKPVSVNLATGSPAGRHVLYAGLVDRYISGHRKNGETAADSKAALNLRFRFCVPWSKMFRRSLIESNNIEFEPVAASNDIMFCTKTALRAGALEASQAVIYCVTKDSGTLMTTPSEQNLDVRIDVLIRRCRLLREHLPEKDYRRLDISGELMLYRSFQWFGFKKLISTARLLRQNKVKLLTLSPFNLKVAISTIRN